MVPRVKSYVRVPYVLLEVKSILQSIVVVCDYKSALLWLQNGVPLCLLPFLHSLPFLHTVIKQQGTDDK